MRGWFRISVGNLIAELYGMKARAEISLEEIVSTAAGNGDVEGVVGLDEARALDILLQALYPMRRKKRK